MKHKELNKLFYYIKIFNNSFEVYEKLDMFEPVYSEEVINFIKDFYDSGLVYKFDWSKYHQKAESFYNNKELLENASIEDIRKLLTYHIRKDRFFGGWLGLMIKNGHILDILKRLNEIIIKK